MPGHPGQDAEAGCVAESQLRKVHFYWTAPAVNDIAQKGVRLIGGPDVKLTAETY